MNFISNDSNGKENEKPSSYNTIGKDSKQPTSNDKKMNNNKSNINLDKNNNLTTRDAHLDINLNCPPETTSDSLSNYIEKETNEKTGKLIRFGVDYCRASPNITLKSKALLAIGWRVQKFNYDVEYEIVNYKGEKQSIHSIMSAIPINKSVIKFEDDFVRESYSKVLKHLTHNHKNYLPYLHFDILSSQKLMIKILRLNEYGSLRDLLYKTYPLNTFAKKYPPNKGKPIHKSLVSLYGRQILEALSYLHANRWYHMHLHTGNILIEDDGSTIKLSELENFVNDVPIRNEHYFYYAYENFNSDFYLNSNKDNNSNVLSQIFKSNYNIFEKIDVICFGRVVYEMTTGRELKSPFPDNLEYKEMDSDIVEVMKLVFNKKTSNVNSNFSITVPDVGVDDILKLKIFSQDSNTYNEENSKKDISYLILFIGMLDKISQNKSYYEDNNAFIGDFDNYCSFIKESIFNQSKFLKNKLKSINNFSNKI